jgi:predicted metal-dependent HD superfamily phosphohydrolase
VYNVLRKDNEERSAEIARLRLPKTGLATEEISLCRQYILATKSHIKSDDHEMNLFTDADLAILGSDQAGYLVYVQQIRKEYKYFPDVLYKPGRKKVLQHFLNMPAIYKTKEFSAKYEQQARTNLSLELEMIG